MGRRSCCSTAGRCIRGCGVRSCRGLRNITACTPWTSRGTGSAHRRCRSCSTASSRRSRTHSRRSDYRSSWSAGRWAGRWHLRGRSRTRSASCVSCSSPRPRGSSRATAGNMRCRGRHSSDSATSSRSRGNRRCCGFSRCRCAAASTATRRSPHCEASSSRGASRRGARLRRRSTRWPIRICATEAGRVAQPALVVAGARDTLVPAPAGAWLAAAMPQGRFALIDGAAHVPFLSHPGEFVNALSGFLDAR